MTCDPRQGWPRQSWYSPRLRGGIPDPGMRVSDADRSKVAEILSAHYSEGRLDKAEFDERLQKAMSATTRGDLAALLTDLPATAPPAPPGPELRRRRGRLGLLFIGLFLLVVAADSPVWPRHFPWLLLAGLFFVVWHLSRRWGWRRYDRARDR